MKPIAEDRVSPGLSRFLNGLSEDDKKCLVGILREPKTYIAEDMMDVLAILRELQGGEENRENA